jgi:acyl dehydratase
MNPSMQGKVYPDVAFTVDPARVAAFREAVGQQEGVPPTFATLAEFTALPEVIGDPELALDFSRILHGSQSYEYVRPLREGETLTVRSRIESIRERAGAGFLTLVTELLQADGAVVCVARSSMVERA